jgi:ribosome modulation factor
MRQDELQMYDLGRQARLAGFQKTVCNLPAISLKRSVWLAGWHDADMELLNSQEVTTEE